MVTRSGKKDNLAKEWGVELGAKRQQAQPRPIRKHHGTVKIDKMAVCYYLVFNTLYIFNMDSPGIDYHRAANWKNFLDRFPKSVNILLVDLDVITVEDNADFLPILISVFDNSCVLR